MSKEQQAAKHPRETLKEHALRLIKEIQECPESMGTHCIQVLCDELEPLIRIADIQSPADLAPVAQPPDDGWVTFGRVKVDIENETERFERIDPNAASVQPPMPQPTGEEAALNALAGMGFMGGVMDTLIKRIAIVVNSAIAGQREVDAAALCDWCARGIPVSFLNHAFQHRLEGETPWVVCRANAIRAGKQQ